MSEITRRNFIESMGAATMAAAGVVAAPVVKTAKAEEASSSGFVPGGGSFAEGALDLGWTGTPPEIEAVGGSTMPLAELQRRRQAYIDSKTTDHVCEDGEIIPALYVKVAAKLNSIGVGCSSDYDNPITANDHGGFTDGALRAIMCDFDEEQARFYLALPVDIDFNLYDAMIATGTPMEQCEEMLDWVNSRGYISRYERNASCVFHCNPFFQGVTEYYTFNHYFRENPDEAFEGATIVIQPGRTGNNVTLEGSTVFHSVPCDPSVMADGSRILDYDDAREILKTKKYIQVAPCFCRYRKALAAGSPTLPAWEDFVNGAEGTFDYYDETIGQYIMNCISVDDEAENAVFKGFARRVTVEEALASLDRSIDEGYVLHCSGGQRLETICMCHVDAGCGILGAYYKLGDYVNLFDGWKNTSRYKLVVDLDSCIGCGSCVARCPMYAITMGEDGKPQVALNCMRCGQCGMVCPMGARKLEALPEEECFEMRRGFVDDNMVKAAFRFEHGYIQ